MMFGASSAARMEISVKKRKTDHLDDENGDNDMNLDKRKFTDFEITRVLSDNYERKMICVEGKFAGSDNKAVVIVEKTALSEKIVKQILTAETQTHCVLDNDIYGTFELQPNPSLNALKSTVIYPATEKHIAKYSTQKAFLVNETEKDYEKITLPYIQTTAFSMQWVYNILEKKSEAERIVFEDPCPDMGFILLPDMKWNGKETTDLYLVAIVHRRDLKSLRDLRTAHIPLLENILKKGQEAIQERYQVSASQLRVYFHYQPSYYHLHVHFTHLHYNAPGHGVEKAHLLTDVLDNLRLSGEYYKRKTLSFVVRENEGLYKKFHEIGRI